MGKAALAEHGDVHVHFVNSDSSLVATQVGKGDLLAGTHVGYLLVVEIDHLVGVFNHRSGVAGNEVFVVLSPDTDHQRAGLAGHYDMVGILTLCDGNGVGAEAASQRTADCIHQFVAV